MKKTILVSADRGETRVAVLEAKAKSGKRDVAELYIERRGRRSIVGLRVRLKIGLRRCFSGRRMVNISTADVRAYVAGPPPMVDASLRLLLREARLSPADIRYDKFS